MSSHNAVAPSVSTGTRVTVHTLAAMSARAEKISVATAYDATFARMFDEGGIDAILVGDSLGMVVQGLDTTLPVTVDEMIYHARAVARGATRAHLIGDMPFMSYQVSPDEALRNAGRFLAEGAMHAVKLEGGTEMAPTIARIVRAGIPVMGHVGLTPQRVHAMGGFKVQGKDEETARAVFDDAVAVAEAGAYALVLEGIPQSLAAEITRTLSIPTIGIGAGPQCDGQVLVCYDMLGLTPHRAPKFVRQYETFFDRGRDAIKRYCSDVREGIFPAPEHCFGKPESDGATANVRGREPIHG